MNWHWSPQMMPLVGAMIVLVGAIIYLAFKEDVTPGKRTVQIFMVMVAGWLLTYILELGTPDLFGKLYWLEWQYPLINIALIAFFAYILQFTGRERWLTLRNLVLLSLYPVATTALLLFEGGSHFFRENIQLKQVGSMVILDYDVGLALLSFYVYVLILLVVAAIWLVKLYIHSHTLYRSQAAMLLIGLAAPATLGTLDLLEIFPIQIYPLGICVTALGMGWSLYRLRLGEILPVAQAVIISGMADGVIVLDLQQRLLDLNPAAEALLHQPKAGLIGRSIEQVLPTCLKMLIAVLEQANYEGEIPCEQADGHHIYDFRISALTDWRGRPVGRVVVLRDVTASKQTEAALRESDQRYRQLLEETQATLVETETLYQLSRELIEFESLSHLLEMLTQAVAEALSATRTVLTMLDLETQQIKGVIVNGSHAERPDIPFDELMQGLTGWTIRELKPAISPKGRPDPRESEIVRQRRLDNNVGSIIVIPLHYQGKIFGTLTAVNHIDKPDFTERQINLVITMAGQAAGAIQNIRLHEQAQQELAERKRAEAALVEERNLLRTLIDYLPDFIYIKDRESRFINGNRAVAQVMGADLPEHLIGKTDFDFYPPEAATEFYTDERTLIQSGRSLVNKNEPILDPEGNQLWVLTTKVPWRNSQGDVVGLVGIGRDISELRQAQETINQAEQRYRTLFEGAPIMYVITLAQEGEPVISDCNQLFLETLGYRREEVVNQPLATFYTPVSSLDLIEGGYQQALEGRFVAQERQLVARDGRVIETILQALPELDTTGRVLGTRAMFVDVTERKATEQALRESEERLRATFEQAAVGIAHVSPEGRWLRVNQKLCDIVGYSPAEMLALTYPDISHPAEHALDRMNAEQLFSSEIKTFTQEKRYLRRDGSLVWVNLTASLVREAEGAPKYFIVVIEDITGRKRDEAMLQKYANELKRSNRELEQFAYIASHDLQEPLRKVQSFGDRLVAKHGETLGEQGRDYLLRMQNAAGRMQDLINGLLAYSRVTTKARGFEAVDLTQIIQEVLGDLEVRLEQTNGRVEVGSLPLIEAEPTQMRQLFQNLIGNALKFHRAGVRPVIKIHSQMAGDLPPGTCRILMTDNGIGFDPKYQDQIFQVFQRLHSRSEFEGTGIGLATCRKIVERHGGNITAEGVPGEGATFMITLPLKQKTGDG